MKGGGHGDYHTIVLAPCSVPEMADLVYDAFDLADKYRNPVMILGDAQIGQLMEPVEFHKNRKKSSGEIMGADRRRREKEKCGQVVLPCKRSTGRVQRPFAEKYRTIEEHEVRYEAINIHKADVILVAYGTSARICKEVVKKSQQYKFRVGMVRPVTLWPFPKEIIRKISERVQCILAVEMSAGQMVEDVKLSVEGRCPVHFYGRTGGGVPTSLEIIRKIVKSYQITTRPIRYYN